MYNCRVVLACLLMVMAGCSREGFKDEPNDDTGNVPTDGDDSAAITVGTLTAAWVTPNQIRWRWEAGGDDSQLVSYELTTGTSEADVEAVTGSAHVWTNGELPELAHAYLPRTLGSEKMTQTTTVAHQPDTLYFARIEARDTAGRVSRSNIAQARTGLAPIGAIVLLADAEPDGYSLPDNFVWSTSAPYAGTGHMQVALDCVDANECWENLRRQDMTPLDASALAPGIFRTAYLELAIANGSTHPAWWADVGLNLGACVDDCVATYTYLTLPSTSSYAIVQVPLQLFNLAAGALTSEQVTTHGLNGFRVGGQWTDNANMRIDEVRVRW